MTQPARSCADREHGPTGGGGVRHRSWSNTGTSPLQVMRKDSRATSSMRLSLSSAPDLAAHTWSGRLQLGGLHPAWVQSSFQDCSHPWSPPPGWAAPHGGQLHFGAQCPEPLLTAFALNFCFWRHAPGRGWQWFRVFFLSGGLEQITKVPFKPRWRSRWEVVRFPGPGLRA